jgi:cystathionine gamma-synthase
MAGKKATDMRHPETLVVHSGLEVEPATGAVAPPLHLSSTFARDEQGALMGPHLYGRYGNPNREALERCLADLEGGAEAACFASGSAAGLALFCSLRAGETIVVGHDMYFGLRQLYGQLGRRFGVVVEEVDLRDSEATRAALALRPALVIVESPTNPLLTVVDLERLAAESHAVGACLVVDNTIATPLLQSPIALGADLVLHSTTKYLAGHSDVIGGALVVADASSDRWVFIREHQRLAGAVPSPFDAWLIRRSIATLSVRLERQIDNAERLAAFFSEHSCVESVIYPGLASHPDHEVAERQLRRPGAMISLRLRGGYEGAARFVGRLTLALRATSLGSVHTLAEHRAVVEGPESSVPKNLVRISVGIEAYPDLEADFTRALKQ